MRRRSVTDDSGATALEYGLIAALIAIVAINALPSMNEAVMSGLTRIAASVGAG